MKCDVISIPSLNAVDYFLEKVSLQISQADAYRFFMNDNDGFSLLEIRTRSNVVAGWNLKISSQYVVSELINNLNNGVSDVVQEKLLRVLEHENSQLLEKHGYGMYTIASMSRYIRKDYPFVYWMALLINPRWWPVENHADISREMLAAALGVNNLSNGQMKAFRKLIYRRVHCRDLQTAILLIARHWELVCPLVAHEMIVDPNALTQGVMMLMLSPELIHSRWFSLLNLTLWNLNYDEGYVQPSIYLKYAFLVANGEAFFHKRDFLSLNDRFRIFIDGVIKNAIKQDFERSSIRAELIDYGRGIVANFPAEVQQNWERRWIYVVDNWRQVEDDALYNRQEISNYVIDSTKFLYFSNMAKDSYFSRVTTAGQLRSIARLLDNCAASRVHLAVDQKSEFWFYDGNSKTEKALLQIDVHANNKNEIIFSIIEFNGYKNRDVSDLAKQRLCMWQSKQTNAQWESGSRW